MKKELLKVSIRQSAIYLPLTERTEERKVLAPTTVALVAKLRKIGYSLSEELLHTVNQVTPTSQVEILQVLKEVLGVDLNWAPLVKGWDIPTGETRLDHLITWIANVWFLIIPSLWKDIMDARSAELRLKLHPLRTSDKEVN